MSKRVVTAHVPADLASAALRDVDSGRLIEHAEVEAWLAGLGGARRGRKRDKEAG